MILPLFQTNTNLEVKTACVFYVRNPENSHLSTELFLIKSCQFRSTANLITLRF